MQFVTPRLSTITRRFASLFNGIAWLRVGTAFLLGLALLGVSAEPVAAQSIASFTPESGAPGTTVTIYGSGFDSSPSNNTVTFGSTDATVTAATSTHLSVEVPSGETGPVELTVTVGGSTATAGRLFTGLLAGQGQRTYTDIYANVQTSLKGLEGGELEWEDYNGDGRPDLIVAGKPGNVGAFTILYQNDGGGIFTKVTAGLVDAGGGVVDWADYDGDGDADLLITGYNGDLAEPYVARIYQNNGDGTFTQVASEGGELVGAAGSADAAWGDYDSDGDPDLVISGQRKDSNGEDGVLTTLYENTSTGFVLRDSTTFAGVANGSVDWGDYNDDGRLDLILSGEDEGRNGSDVTQLYRNDGNGDFTEVLDGLPDLAYSEFAWGDYNSDGKLDLAVVGDGGGAATRIYKNEGNGDFVEQDFEMTGVGRGDNPSVTWADIEGDGDPDLLLTGRDNSGTPRSILYRNEGGVAFDSVDAGLKGANDDGGDGAFGDFNQDGTLDLALMGGQDGGVQFMKIYRSEGDGSPWPARGLLAGGGVQEVGLDWSASPSEDGDVTSYNIYRNTSPIDSTNGPSNLTPVATVDTPTTSYTDASVTADTRYYYRVTAVDSDGFESSTSNESSAIPSKTALAISNVAPLSGAPGARIEIYGSNFASDPSNNTVTFGGTNATVTAASASKLTVEVPKGLTAGTVELTVQADNDQATSGRSFTALSPGQGQRTYTDIYANVQTSLKGLEGGELEWEDYNGDGRPDLIVAGKPGNVGAFTILYQNDGGGIFTKVTAGLVDAGGGVVDWADYDGDGDADLLITGYNGDLAEPYVARIYQNNGDGTFTQVASEGGELVGAAGSADAAWGDYDGDGDPDLVISGQRKDSNGEDGVLTVLYENTSTGFVLRDSTTFAGVANGSVDWGDYNDDGRLDLILSGEDAGRNGSDVTQLYRNDGNGDFTEVLDGLPDLAYSEFAWGDYNSDGKLDLAVVGDGGGAATRIYKNEGSGQFVKQDFGMTGVGKGNNPTVTWGDIEGDGDPDLLITGRDNSGTPRSILYRNESGVAFDSLDAGLTGANEKGGDGAFGDFNQDGVLDLALMGGQGGGVQFMKIYRSEGDGSPWPARGLAVTSELRDVDLTWTASPSEDGDVVGYNVYRDTAPIDSSAGPSGMTPVATVDTPATSYTDASAEIGTQYHYRVAALDSSDLESGFTAEVTATPTQPLVVSGFTPESGAPDTSVTIYGGGFSTTASENTVTFGSATATVTNATQNSLTVTVPSGVVGPTTLTVEKDGESVTAARRFTALQARTTVRSLTGTDVGLDGLRNGSVALGDLDGDNHIDVAMVGEGAGGTPTTRLYENNGNGTYTAMNAGLTGVTDGSVALGDLNGDNRLDVVIAGEKDDGTPVTKLYRNDGGGSFTAMNAGLPGLRSGSVALGDLNGNNMIDVAMVGEGAGGTPTTTLYSNDGSGSFTAMNAGLTDLTNGSIALGDLDGDNHLDVAVLGEQSDGTPTTRLYQNDGGGSFSALSSLTGLTNGSIALGDLNGDNMLDVATVGEESGGTPVTRLYSNDGSGSFSALNAGLTGVSDGAVALGDLNGNNRIDLAIAGTDADGNGVLDAYRNTPEGWTAVRPGPITFVPQRDGMAFGDAEGDGDLDLVAVGNGVGSESTPGAGGFENVYPSPDGVTASAGTREAALDWQKTAGSQLATYRLYRSTTPIDSLGDPSGLTPFDSVSTGTTSYTDTDLDEGQTYYYRVTAVAETGEGSPLSAQNYAFLYPGSVTADVSRSFDDASSTEDYRLVALPGQVDRPLESTLNGEAGTKWQAYWDDGSDSDFLRRFDGSEAFTLERGRGFWLTSQSDWMVEDSIETVDLKNDTSTTVPLNSGWTIISNPLGKSVDWALVERANGGDLQPLWEFGGTFTQAQSFASATTGTAYYFFNDTGKDSLTVPYPGAPKFREVPKTGQAENAMLALSATSARGDAPASTVHVGIAKTEDARQSIIAPPGRFAETSLRIEAPGETDSKRGRTLMAERRPRGDEAGQTFRLRLTNRADGPVRLSAEHLEATDGRAVALLHPSAGKTYDLREEETVEIEPEAETTELKVALGTDSYVKDQTDKVLPDEVTLSSYPNPARQQGTVEYALPEKAEVTLRLYDVLGREVATIAQGRKTAGRHRVQLEVGRLASGVYFGRLQVGDQTLTQKITVVR